LRKGKKREGAQTKKEKRGGIGEIWRSTQGGTKGPIPGPGKGKEGWLIRVRRGRLTSFSIRGRKKERRAGAGGHHGGKESAKDK